MYPFDKSVIFITLIMKKLWKNTYFWSLIVVLVFVGFFRLGYKIYKIDGKSMYPTVLHGEVVLAKCNFEIKRNDVVVIEKDGDKLVKRIVGMPNDTIEIISGYIYVNGKKIEDSFGIGRITYYLTDDDDKILTYWSGPNIGSPVVKFAEHALITLSGEEYYYIGDHRSISMYGVTKKINIVGKIVGGF